VGLFSWLFGESNPQRVQADNLSHSDDNASILDEAENLVLDLWREQRSLGRQAIFWDAGNEISMVGFTSAAARDATLQELRDSAKDRSPRRVFFFSESSAFAPNGQKIDVIVIEVGDAQLNFYGQRIYSAEKEPKRLAEETTPLGESPFANLLSI
jgi:hypothetical protein